MLLILEEDAASARPRRRLQAAEQSIASKLLLTLTLLPSSTPFPTARAIYPGPHITPFPRNTPPKLTPKKQFFNACLITDQPHSIWWERCSQPERKISQHMKDINEKHKKWTYWSKNAVTTIRVVRRESIQLWKKKHIRLFQHHCLIGIINFSDHLFDQHYSGKFWDIWINLNLTYCIVFFVTFGLAFGGFYITLL